MVHMETEKATEEDSVVVTVAVGGVAGLTEALEVTVASRLSRCQ